MQPMRNPEPSPQPVQPSPAIQPVPQQPERKRHWLVWLGVLAMAGVGLYLFRGQLFPSLGGGGPVAVATRTATVSSGSLERTLRLTGVTRAEKAATLIVPQMRGGRGGMSVSVSSGPGGSMQVSVSMSGGGDRGGSAGSSGSSAASSAASSGSASMASSSGSGSGGGSSAGLRGASNRFSSASSAATRSSSSSSRSSVVSSSSGGDSGGGGGGRGGRGDMSFMSGGMMDFQQVIHKLADSGKILKKGDFVAEFDKLNQTLRLDDYKSSVESSKRGQRITESSIEVSQKAREQTIAQLRAAVDKAKLDIKTTPVRSAIQAEQLKLALEEAEASLRETLTETPYREIGWAVQRRNAEIEIEQSAIELRRAEQNLEKMTLTAPMDGLLVMQSMRRGNEMGQIRAGDQLFPGQPFAQIVDPNSMLVVATVNQADSELIHVGAKAMLEFDAYPGLRLPAHVTSIGAMTGTGGMRANYFKEISVYLKLDKIDPRIIPDLTASADVVLEAVHDVVTAPIEAVFRDSPEARPHVFVKSGAEFTRREVKTGLKNNVRTVVVEGLQPGDVVAVEKPAAPQKPKDGSNVQRS